MKAGLQCNPWIVTRPVLVVLTVALFMLADDDAAQSPKRKVPCKTPENAPSCYWVRGRLSYYNGTPAFRLWKVGSHRLLGIYSGPSVDRHSLDNEGPEFPVEVRNSFKPPTNRIFADFEVCPIEPERPGTMQAACIESAKNIVVEK